MRDEWLFSPAKLRNFSYLCGRMDRKSAILIINPISGTSSKDGLDRMVRDSLAPHFDIDVRWTKGQGDATRIAREAVEQGIHSVFAAGGDGTVNETARALCGTDVALGILPCGSGNGLARHLEIPVDITDALGIIGEDHITACDHGIVNGREFFCTFGVGFDALVSEKFANDKRRGKLTYLRNTVKEYFSYDAEEYTIVANGKVLTERALLVAVCNASQYGNNAYIAPNASITDGLLDITVVHMGSPLTTALVGVDLLTGYINRNTLIDSFRVSEAVIKRSKKGPAHIDGEPVEMGDEIAVKCNAGALHVYTPVIDHPFRPVITPIQSMMRDLHYSLSHIFQK